MQKSFTVPAVAFVAISFVADNQIDRQQAMPCTATMHFADSLH